MAKKKVEDYFTGAVSSPLASAPAAENLQWIPQVSPEAQLERTALVHGLDDRPPMVTQAPPDMYQQAVALDSSREPAATPADRTLPMNANEATMARVMALNGNGLTPAIDPTVRVPDQVVNGMPFAQPQVTQGYPTTTIGSFDPAFVDATTISVPQWIGKTNSESLAIELSITFTTAHVFISFFLHKSNAA